MSDCDYKFPRTSLPNPPISIDERSTYSSHRDNVSQSTGQISSRYFQDLAGIDFAATTFQSTSDSLNKTGLTFSDNDVSVVKDGTLYPDLSSIFIEAKARDPHVKHIVRPQRPLPSTPFVAFNPGYATYQDPSNVIPQPRPPRPPSHTVTNPNYAIGFDGLLQENNLINHLPYPIYKVPVSNELSSTTEVNTINHEHHLFNQSVARKLSHEIPSDKNPNVLSNSRWECEYLSINDFDPLYDVVKEQSDSEGIYQCLSEFSTLDRRRHETPDYVPIPDIPLTTQLSSHGYDKLNKPLRPPRPSFKNRNQSEESHTYETLKPVTFIDRETQNFCDMVESLKKKYPSSDGTTNKGYISNPKLSYTKLEASSIKIIVYIPNVHEPVTFTCDANLSVGHVIGQVLYGCDHISLFSADDFLLKIYDRSEYLNNSVKLSQYSYINSCLKADKDIKFMLMEKSKINPPLLRTIEDDNKPLYFAHDFIQKDPGDVSRESLEILMDTFYREVEKLQDHTLQGMTEIHMCRSLIQSVKAICAILAKIEMMSVTKAVHKIENIMQQLSGRPSLVLDVSDYDVYSDSQSTITFNMEEKCNLMESFVDALDELIIAVQDQVKLYCQTFQLDFNLRDHDRDKEHLVKQDVMSIPDHFIIHFASAHHLPSVSLRMYNTWYIKCSMHYGTSQLGETVTTRCVPLNQTGLCERVVWDEWLEMKDLQLNRLPRETRVCITLYGIKSDDSSHETHAVLGGATIPLFDFNEEMEQGSQLIILEPGKSADPYGSRLNVLLKDSSLIQLNLPDFGKIITFPNVNPHIRSAIESFDFLNEEVKESLNNIKLKDCLSLLDPAEKDLVWNKRGYLTNFPEMLPKVLKSAPSWEWSNLSEIYALMYTWVPLKLEHALQLLLPEFADSQVRRYAVDCIGSFESDEILDVLPQLIQAVKFECFHNSTLAKFLLERLCLNPTYAHNLFWLIKEAAVDTVYRRRYHLLFGALMSLAGGSLCNEFHKQEHLMQIISNMADLVKTAKDRDKCLSLELPKIIDMFESKSSIRLPLSAGMEVIGVDTRSSSYFSSNAFPLKLVFKNVNLRAESIYTMFKAGDDLRQDVLTLQFIRIMDNLWRRSGLDLHMLTYKVLPTGPKRGMVELITESETLRKIQTIHGVTGSFKDQSISLWLQKHNTTELDYERAVSNFMRSCAGYCVATYTLGICDRHNDNIMIRQSGHLFHIDFGKFLGDAQMFGAFRRDRVPFVLTPDMAYVINDGGRNTRRFQHFVDLCCWAFNVLRSYTDLFLSLFTLMSKAGIPGVTEASVNYVQKALLPLSTSAEATSLFSKMIDESVKSLSTQFNFLIHNLAQKRFSSHNEGQLLDFIPKTYTIFTDDRILNVEVLHCVKRYTPDKHYFYMIRLNREGHKLPSVIFRSYSEFVKFREKLVSTFPLTDWPEFIYRVIIGRSQIKTVAENRKNDIDNFLKVLLLKAPEIAECDLVYTFFHPLLRDEQFDTDILSQSEKDSTAIYDGSCTTRGQIKVSISYSRSELCIMVMHAKDLGFGLHSSPNSCVQVYLLPDPQRRTKRCTKYCDANSHPIYNEIFKYKIAREQVAEKTLQLTVWHRDLLRKKQFLGAVFVCLRHFNLNTENISWYTLGSLQMHDSHFVQGPS